MNNDLTWIMNCVLFGARAQKLVREGATQAALEEIRNLSSLFDSKTAEYLLMRLEEGIKTGDF
jgi:hypothetical protein